MFPSSPSDAARLPRPAAAPTALVSALSGLRRSSRLMAASAAAAFMAQPREQAGPA